MPRRRIAMLLAVAVLLVLPGATFALVGDAIPGLPGFRGAAPARQDADAQIELGRLLFFDGRLSGDGSVSCATCHSATNAYADGRDLSIGYPQTLYFRNTPSLLGASGNAWLYWDGRFAGTDMQSLVRDHLTEAHFMSADGRLIQERLKQVPDYVALFDDAFGGEPSFGGVLRALSAFVATLQHEETAYDRFLAGDTNALSPEAQLGLELFNGEAGCAACHSGPALTDGQFHSTGVPTNEEIFADPLRHITFRRFFRNLGVPDFANLREDIGLAALTKEDADIGQFRTPSLLGVADTAPYMHNGMIATLEDVIQFYNAGGGGANAEAVLQPLGLTDAEAAALVAFLRSLSAMPAPVESPTLPAYDVRPLGDN